MKKILILMLFSTLQYFNSQTTMRTLSDAKLLQTNQKEFVGKPLSYLLEHIKLEIKGVQPLPNKDKNEAHILTFLFVKYNEYEKLRAKNEIQDGPTKICVTLSQNWDMNSKNRCNSSKPECLIWTQNDAKNLGHIIVADVSVIGNK